MDSEFSKLSPLYEYWQSEQDDNQEEKRLDIGNPKSPAFPLFLKEPYKWENLFQSIVKQISLGDEESIRGFSLLLGTLKTSQRESIMQNIKDQNIFTRNIIIDIENSLKHPINRTKKANHLRFIKILFAIFTNPYGISIKRKKQHIYEFTGAFFYALRHLILNNYK